MWKKVVRQCRMKSLFIVYWIFPPVHLFSIVSSNTTWRKDDRKYWSKNVEIIYHRVPFHLFLLVEAFLWARRISYFLQRTRIQIVKVFCEEFWKYFCFPRPVMTSEKYCTTSTFRSSSSFILFWVLLVRHCSIGVLKGIKIKIFQNEWEQNRIFFRYYRVSFTQQDLRKLIYLLILRRFPLLLWKKFD